MRRDYFICVFLMLMAISLSFVCLLPTCYSYDGVIPREAGLIEAILSTFFAVITLVALPIFTAVKKKLWAMLGTAGFGLLAYIPGIFLSKMTTTLAASDVSMGASLKAFILKDIYIMMNAPFVGIGSLIGDKIALVLPKLILPCSLVIYGVIWLFRFYRDAYLSERLSPIPVSEPPKAESSTRKPDILGTVISAPVTPENNQAQQTVAPRPAPTAAPAPAPKRVATPAPAKTQAPKRAPAPQPAAKQVAAPEPRKQVRAPEPVPKISSETRVTPPVRPSEEGVHSENPGVRKPNINISFDTIPLGAPETPKNDAIQLGAPSKSEAIQLEAPKNNGTIHLGPPTGGK